MKIKVFFKTSFLLFLMLSFTSLVYANVNSFNSSYDIRHGSAGYGTLDSRTFELSTNNRSVSITLSPTQVSNGTLWAGLRRQGLLGVWSWQGQTQEFSNDSRTTRTFRGGNSGTHRIRIISYGYWGVNARGSVSVSW